MFVSTSPFPRDSESHKADDSRERSARLVKKTAWLMGCSPDNKWLSNFKNHQRCRANMETMTAHSRSISTGSTELCLELQKGDTGWRGWTIIRWSVTGCPMQPCLMAPRHRRANRCAKSRCYSRKWSEKKTCVIGKACNFMGHVPLLCQLTREVLFKCIWVSNLSPNGHTSIWFGEWNTSHVQLFGLSSTCIDMFLNNLLTCDHAGW